MSIDLRKRIIKHIKQNPAIKTNLSNITIESKILGEGGTAIVYSSICKKYAIKFLVEDISKPKESQIYLRFKQEFSALFELSKRERTIVEILDHGSIKIVGDEEEGKHIFIIPFIVMKKYFGSLKVLRKDISVEKLDDLDAFFSELINLVDIVHGKKIIHRDIKPENIFIDEREKMILGDFGIAWFDESIYQKLARTDKSDRLANFNFSAPEQFIPGTKAAFTMDLFAVGQMLQWYVTGKTIKGSGSPKISETLGGNAFYYDVIIEKLLQENPLHRPQNIEELRQLWILEKKNSWNNWLLYSNKDYCAFINTLQEWKNEDLIPNPKRADSILVNLYEEILQTNEILFLLGSMFFSGSKSDFIDYSWDHNLGLLVNYHQEDIFESFEAEFSKIGQDGIYFDFKKFESDALTVKTDNFILYYFDQDDRKQTFSCLYSEITNNPTGEVYLLLVLNDDRLSYRLKRI